MQFSETESDLVLCRCSVQSYSAVLTIAGLFQDIQSRLVAGMSISPFLPPITDRDFLKSSFSSPLRDHRSFRWVKVSIRDPAFDFQ